MERKDYITAAISILALVVATFTAYKQIFPSTDLVYYINYIGANSKGNQHYEPYADIAISNLGNTPGVVISLALYFVAESQRCDQRPETNWKRFLVDDKESVAAAFAIKGGDATARRIVFSELDLSASFPPGIWNVGFIPCLELGTLDQHNTSKWKTESVGHLWFDAWGRFPSSDHVVVAGTLSR
jgi:hypothetical protein